MLEGGGAQVCSDALDTYDPLDWERPWLDRVPVPPLVRLECELRRKELPVCRELLSECCDFAIDCGGVYRSADGDDPERDAASPLPCSEAV